MSNVLQNIENTFLRSDLPDINVGDQLEITSLKDEKKNTFFSFKGVIIAQKNKNKLSYSFTVMREINKLVITSVFFYHLSAIISIKKIGQLKDIRRSKIYYIRNRLIEKKKGE